MSISAVAAPIKLTGNGSATEFAFPWLVEDADHLNVYLYDTDTEEQTLIDPVLYSVEGVGDDDGGSVTYPLSGTPIAATEWIIIEPAAPYTQEFSPTNQRDYLPAALEGQLDHTTRQVQQLKDRTDRMPLLIQGETFERQLTRKADLADKVLGFDEDGEPYARDPGSVALGVPGDGTVDFDTLDSGLIATEPEVLAAAQTEKLTTPALLRTHQAGYGDHPSWYGIAFDGVTDDDAGWADAIEAFNNNDTKSLLLHSGTSIVNTALPVVLANDVSIVGHVKSSRLLIPSGSGNLGTFFTVGDEITVPIRFALSGVQLQCDNFATLNASSGHAIYLRAANRATIRDIDVVNTAGFIRCGDGTIGTLQGRASSATVDNIRGTVWMNAGVSIYHFERMNGSHFTNCAVGGLEAAVVGMASGPPVNVVAPILTGTPEVGEVLSVAVGEWIEPGVEALTIPDTFAGLKFIPTGGEECDGNVFYDIKLNFGTGGPHCNAMLVDVTGGAVDNARFTDCTFDLTTKPVVHIKCDETHEANSQVTRMLFQSCRFTPSLDVSVDHPSGNEYPGLLIDNAANVPIHNLVFKGGVLGMARGPAVEINGDEGSLRTTVGIVDTIFNDRAGGLGSPKPCIRTNVGGLWVKGCNIQPAISNNPVEVTYLVDFTENEDEFPTEFDISGNDASNASVGVVNTENLPQTIQRTERIRENMGPFGYGQADRLITTVNDTVVVIAQVPLDDDRTYQIHVKHVAVSAAGASRQQNEGIFEFHRTGGAGAVLSKSTTVLPQPTYYTGSVVYDPVSLVDGTGVTTTVTVTGAALGDFVEGVSYSLSLQGILMTAWVSTANTVSVRFQNETGGDLDIGSGAATISVRVRSNAARVPSWGGLSMVASGNFAQVQVQGGAAVTVRHAVLVDVVSGAETA